MVRRLYSDYPVAGGEAVWNEPKEIVARYFDARLAGLFIEEQACRSRVQGPCAITFHLLCACQDGAPADVRFCRSSRGDAWVDVRFFLSGREETVAFQVMKATDGWRISDMAYEDGGSLAQSLRRQLDDLAKLAPSSAPPRQPTR